MLDTYSLEEIFFVLYCYIHKQAEIVKSQNSDLEKIDWKKLTEILDNACNIIEKANEDTEKDNFYLIY